MMNGRRTNTMKRSVLLAMMAIGGLLLSACGSGPAPRPNLAIYDLGSVEPLAGNPNIVASIDVHAPSWLDSRAMQYRLATEPSRRQNFTESRWAATPTELLAVALRRQLGAAGGVGCALRVDLDEWVQVFDGAGQSRVQLALQVALRSGRSDNLIERRSFNLEQAAGSDARQGVAAFVLQEKQLATGLDAWLKSVAREQKDLAARCRA